MPFCCTENEGKPENGVRSTTLPCQSPKIPNFLFQYPCAIPLILLQCAYIYSVKLGKGFGSAKSKNRSPHERARRFGF
jgi:hypothetical protein